MTKASSSTAQITQRNRHQVQSEDVGNVKEMLVSSASTTSSTCRTPTTTTTTLKTVLKDLMGELVEVEGRVDVALHRPVDDVQLTAVVLGGKEHRLGEHQLHVHVVVLNASVELLVTLCLRSTDARLILE